MIETVVKVDGMMCGMCESHVNDAVRKAFPEAKKVASSHTKGQTVIHSEQALDEAQRCLHCKNKPCMQGCPVMVHIPDFIAEVAKGDFEAAYQIIAATVSYTHLTLPTIA